ncbi:RNI-like protein [Suillus hirtellus]|nr:RNI-like protein [Suillus hirtellus]
MYHVLAAIGSRIYLPSGYFGTVKYFGPIDGTAGLWLGVEWDDPTRGKHDGIKDGKRYFNCRVPHSGSFIRPSSACYGYPFLQALKNKYVEAVHGTASQEKIVLGSSNGAIEVEAVDLDKIRGKFSNLERLREVSLDNEMVSTGNNPGEILSTCPNVRGLDLSATLVSSWDVVAMITTELHQLERLALNRNRLTPPSSHLPASAWLRLSELQLNGTWISWEEFTSIAILMPQLRMVELGYNGLTSLSHAKISTVLGNIEILNFDSNKLEDWQHISEAMKPCTSLQRLILSSNGIERIPPRESHPSHLQGLKVLSLSSNKLHNSRDIDQLYEWCPNLETLSLAKNSLSEVSDVSRSARQQVIAKIPSLRVLDATAISTKERSDSELFYLSFVAKTVLGHDEDKLKEHPQWKTLCMKHGRPAESTADRDGRLGRYLIEVKVHQCSEPPEGLFTPGMQGGLIASTSLRVLSTMKLGLFRLRLVKALGAGKNPRNRHNICVWLRMGDDTLALLQNDDQELGWWGIENNSHIVVHISRQTES